MPVRRRITGVLVQPVDRPVLAAWLLTRVAMVAIASAAASLLHQGDLRESFFDRWTQWDVDLLIEIARFGYAGDPADEPDEGLHAFFPGFPALLRAVHVVVPDWRYAALLISFCAGAVAVVALARLGAYEGPAGTGPRAALALLLCPVAVFLSAGYTEALFLALALPAWLLARRGRWAGAALCAAGASTVRVTALFLAIALVVEYVTARDPNGPGTGGRTPPAGWSAIARWRPAAGWRAAPWLVVPFLPMAGYVTYLWSRTGDWFAWQHAQEAGWGRSLVPPWQALQTTWHEAVSVGGPFTDAFRAELVAAALGLLVTGWLVARRRWAESVFMGLQMAALLSSAFYLSIGRSTLLWWPLWLAIGAMGVRRPWLYAGYLAVSVPLMAWYVVRFTSGAWAG